MEQATKKYLNRVQMMVQMIQAQRTVAVVSRGMGKSTGIGPVWFLPRVQLMPGGASFILGSSYQQILTRTLPPFESMLKKMGLVDGVHYVVNQQLPNHWEAEPIVMPRDWKNTITWSNGHITYLVSQERKGIPNSLSVQFGMVDEARLINVERFNTDMVPAIRGNHELFGHLAEYRSLLFMTDQPRGSAGDWIMDMEKEMDDKQIALIATYFHLMQETRHKMASATAPTTIARLGRELTKLKDLYNEVRKESVLFVEGNVFENIHVLKEEYVRDQKKLLTPYEFDISILNKRAQKNPNTFYPDLDENKHCYTEEYNYHYLDKLNRDEAERPDWRQDADLDINQPFRIGSDHGASFNGIVIGQGNSSLLNVRNFMCVLNGQTTEDLFEEFCTYYKGYPFNKVIWYHDHTMIAESGKARNITYIQEGCAVLSKYGWEVELVYLGHTPGYTDRFQLASSCFRGFSGYCQVRFNRLKTEVLRTAMHMARAKTGRKDNQLVKDKADERKDDVRQDKTTHGPDAFDILLWGTVRPTQSRGDNRALPAATT